MDENVISTTYFEDFGAPILSIFFSTYHLRLLWIWMLTLNIYIQCAKKFSI